MRAAAALVLAIFVTASCGSQHHARAGRFLVYTRALGKKSQAVWIARTDGTDARLLARGAVYGAVSPDGRWVAYGKCLVARARCERGNEPLALFLVSPSGRRSRLLARGFAYAGWSPTSDLIVGVRAQALATVDLDGHVRMFQQAPGSAGWSFSPDGKWLVYADARQHTKCGSDLYIAAARGGRPRRLTHGRDIIPAWGAHWIAFSRAPAGCAYTRRIWRIRPDGSGARPITPPLPPRLRRKGYYGLDAVEWSPDERVLLAGLATEWGPEAIRVEVATGRYRKLVGYADDLSRDGRTALVDSDGVEPPETVWAVPIDGGAKRVLVHGDVAFPSWNR